MIETSLSNKDILYESMKSAIKKFYREEFSNGGKRDYHLNLLHNNYNRTRFEKCSDIGKERDKFLTELQDLADSTYVNG